ncbi:ABC transporter ATP-binding protein/permease [Rhizobiaceae bacterium BDR2-2]|uniref:ABC transporter ATP-binding protein/permease n=1 Tax=Ectorhizobium quercum TaxID=2965071 RepID=A0AAE3MX63_9HYPH|nr:ABC transporter ATP-binding protein [Ectorhizobium quercum]MCX8996589.1 ABC transporter ATP-binding protein/permease [Ectorhizobium quercum]
MIIKAILRPFENWISPFAEKGDVRPPDTVWRFVWFYVRQAKSVIATLIVLGGLTALIEAGLFYFTGRLVDILDVTARENGWSGLLADHGWELAFMLSVVLVWRFLIMLANALTDEQVMAPGFSFLTRWQAYRHVSRQSLSFFQNDLSGRIVSRIAQGTQAVYDLVSTLIQNIWFVAIYLVSTVALMAGLDWRLAVPILMWVVGFAFIARYFVPRIRVRAREFADTASMLNGRITDSFANIQTLKLFSSERESDAYVLDGFERNRNAALAFSRLIVGARSSMNLLAGMMISLLAVLSIDLWLKGQVTTGGIAFSLGLMLRFNMLLGRTMGQINGLMRNIGTIQNAAEMISAPIDLTDRPDAVPLVVTGPEIRFENMTFGYGAARPVIQGFDLTIRPGEKVGIVGRSGAGKSTLVNLLLRFYDVSGGRILIDGQDIAAVTQQSLRSAIGMVTQDTSLLHRSIRDNIMIGRPGASEAELAAALKRAEADRFVASLEDHRGRKGLDAQVGERGVKLSGGQRQRIAIARVMLKDAPILVLDEATSALDSEIEAVIQSNLDRLMSGKTVLAIAHRLSTIAALDRLVVMDAGRIVEQGTHAELTARGGLYAELWARQSGGFIAAEENLAR